MTPLEKVGALYFKREDLNPTGSTKDRALPHQIRRLLDLGYHSAVISSTGNAAISAQYFCQQQHIPLTIFVSPHTHPHKLALLHHYQLSPQPISQALKYAKAHHAYFLRQSTDPAALEGYQDLGRELLTQLPQITSLFVPVGSGTTLLGISQALPKTVKIFAVQPASHCPIASVFDHDFTPETTSTTDALGAKLLPLKKQVLAAAFSGIVVQDADLRSQSIPSSPEGALALAGFYKAQKTHPLGDFPVILLTGARR